MKNTKPKSTDHKSDPKSKPVQYIGYFSENHARDNGASYYQNTRSGYPVLVSLIVHEDDIKTVPEGLVKIGPVGPYLKAHTKYCRVSDPREEKKK